MLQNSTKNESEDQRNAKLPEGNLVTLRDPAKVRASLYAPNRKR